MQKRSFGWNQACHSVLHDEFCRLSLKSALNTCWLLLKPQGILDMQDTSSKFNLGCWQYSAYLEKIQTYSLRCENL